jgi:hypothetical protein
VLEQAMRKLGNREDENQIEEQFGERDAMMAMFVMDPQLAVPRAEHVAVSAENYLIASGLTGEPTAPVIGIAGATNRNS